MLQKFRERMQGIIAWTIVIAICITFALWGIQNYLHGDSSGNYLAKVNGVKITQKKLLTAYEILRNEKMRQLGADYQFDQASQLELKKEVLDRLIKEEVVMQGAQKMGIYMPLAEVYQFIYSLPQFQRNGAFSPEAFSRYLSAVYNGSEMEFVAEVQKSLSFGQLEVGIKASEFVLPAEVDTAMRLKDQTRDFGYYFIDAKKFINTVKVSPQEIQDYYDKNKNDFATSEQISIEYLQLATDDLQKKANLPLPNKKLSAKEKNEYQRQQTLQLFNDEYEKLSDLTYTNSDSLAPAASALSLPIKTTGLFTKKGEVSGLAQNKKVLKIAFSDSVLKQGYNSNPVEISSGNVVVLRIKQHIPATTIPLEKVKTQIQNILLMEKAKAAAKEMSQQLLADLKQNKKPESLASRYNLPWKVLSKVKMANTNVNAEILKTAFDLPTPKDSEIGIKNVVLANGDCAVVVLYKTYIPNVTAKVDADKGQMQKLLQKDVADFTYAQFINGLMAKAKIKKEDLDKKSASDGGANVPLDDD